jgi:hypothetical protein
LGPVLFTFKIQDVLKFLKGGQAESVKMQRLEVSGVALVVKRLSVSIINFLQGVLASVFIFVCFFTPQDTVEKVDQTENMMDIMEKGDRNMLSETKHERFSRISIPTHL